MDLIKDWLGLGLDPKDLTILHVTLRGIIVFLASIVMVRIGDKRFLSKKTPFDVVLGLILASVMARAINGSGPLVPTLVGGLVIVLLHRLLASVARRSHRFGWLIKGSSERLIENGRVDQAALEKNDFSKHDLEEDLRLKGVNSPAEVKLAFIERNGEISVIKA